jgi:hypothetical protein
MGIIEACTIMPKKKKSHGLKQPDHIFKYCTVLQLLWQQQQQQKQQKQKQQQQKQQQQQHLRLLIKVAAMIFIHSSFIICQSKYCCRNMLNRYRYPMVTEEYQN